MHTNTALDYSVFISIRYTYDQIVERSLSRHLKNNEITSYFHKGTIDIVEKNKPFFLNFDFGKLYFGSDDKTQETVKRDKIIEYLVTEVSKHDLVVIVWSRHYSNSFWTMLELECAQKFKKNIVVITTDEEPLDKSLLQNDIAIFDFNFNYKTSNIVEHINRLLHNKTKKPVHDLTKRMLKDYFKDLHSSIKMKEYLTYSEIKEYKRFINSLMNLNEDKLEAIFKKRSEDGYFNHEFRLFIELILQGKIEAEMDILFVSVL